VAWSRRLGLDRRASPRPYLREAGVKFLRPTHSYIPMAHGFVYLAAVMDRFGPRFLDNIFIERLWRSLKYEEVFIHGSVPQGNRLNVMRSDG
jgi:hypothetical protein